MRVKNESPCMHVEVSLAKVETFGSPNVVNNKAPHFLCDTDDSGCNSY